MCSANLDVSKHITNHTVQKVLMKKLKKAGVNNMEIVAITGHKGEDSLKHYDNIDDHRRISRYLSGGNPLSELNHTQMKINRLCSRPFMLPVHWIILATVYILSSYCTNSKYCCINVAK